MPLPSPRNKEKRGDFVNRCMADLSKKGEFKDAKQELPSVMMLLRRLKRRPPSLSERGVIRFFTLRSRLMPPKDLVAKSAAIKLISYWVVRPTQRLLSPSHI